MPLDPNDERTFTASVTIDGERFAVTESAFMHPGAEALGLVDYMRRATVMKLINHLIDNGKINKLIDMKETPSAP